MRFIEGGVVADIFRYLKKPMRFSGGGGGSSGIFLFPNLKTSFSVNGALLHFFTFPKGGPGPPGPPPESATALGLTHQLLSWELPYR